MSVIEGDLRKIKKIIKAESYDRVVCNPPYGKQGSGRINPGAEQALARHEINATLEDIVRAASHAVKNRGKVYFIYPASRSVALLYELRLCRLEPKRIQPIYSYPEDPAARLLLLEAVKNGGEGLDILQPFYIYTSQNGVYTDEMENMFSPEKTTV